MTHLRVGFVGDSITHGTGDETLLGWPLRLGQAERARGNDVTVYNLGVRADTSALVAGRWEAECAARLLPIFSCATVFAVGINDSAHEKSPSRDGQRVPQDGSVAAIAGMIVAARRFGPSLWVGPTPVVEHMMPLRLTDAISYDFSNATIAAYNAAFAARAARDGIPYLDLYTPLSADPAWEASLRASDGLHPSAAGYEIMARLIGAWEGWRNTVDAA